MKNNPQFEVGDLVRITYSPCYGDIGIVIKCACFDIAGAREWHYLVHVTDGYDIWLYAGELVKQSK